MNIKELQMLQALPLDIKIAKSKLRIEEFIRHMGGPDKVYISFSGGKDSTVLLHLVRSIYPNITGVFSNTGLEFPEIVQFTKTLENIKEIRPKKSFKQVLESEGYPLVNKKTARMIHDCQNPTPYNSKSRKLYLSNFTLDENGKETNIKNRSFKIANKWLYLIDAPFKISHKCCDYLKKAPLKIYQKETDQKPIIGTMASESKMREAYYLQTGCNSFREGAENCTPLGFWTEQDIYSYIKLFDLPYATIYGEILKNGQGKYYTTGEHRTGCIFCGFCKDEKQLSERYLRLEQTHPLLHKYCMEQLGFKDVLNYMDIKYSKYQEYQLSIDDIMGK